MNTEPHPKCLPPAIGHPSVSDADDSGLARRQFLRLIGAGATTALAFHPWPSAMAGPFARADFEKLVPADKKLSPDWVKSLTTRGERSRYHGADLAKIGMPIGGLCAGQVYLGGDGRLWHWDIFNRQIGTGAEHYAKPMTAASPLEQGFAVRAVVAGTAQDRVLEASQWRKVSFVGEYPIGYVEYTDPASPLEVGLEAFSPFIPLNTDDSSIPATILEFTLRNTGAVEIEAELAGWLENAVCRYSGERRDGFRRTRLVRDAGALVLECSAEEAPPSSAVERPDIVFDDFERDAYGQWTATGTAFGTGPVEAGKMPEYQGDVGAKGRRLVNSHASAPGGSVAEKDAATGRLVSRAFALERHYLTFLIGGGNHQGRTCLNLVVDGQVVRSATGAANNRLQPLSWDVRPWAGKTARIEIVDAETGGWGNIGVDDIVLSDRPRQSFGPLAAEADFGTLALALLEPQSNDFGSTALGADGIPRGVFSSGAVTTDPVRRPFGQKLVGALGRRFKLAPGASAKATFAIAWHMPNLKMDRLPPGRWYSTRFDSARSVAAFVAANLGRLSRETRLWHDTWYDSTLPYWFLDRTFLNTSILATSTCYRFADGRFYAWEGVGCCAGTCGHVWQYAHAPARLFPKLERETRERVDFGLALQPDGAIRFRGEFNDIPAIDAQAGAILRALREHQMTPDNAWIQKHWPRIRKAVEWLIAKDGDGDGLIEGNQHNTLDTDWFGPVAWLSGLYLAALLAAADLADTVGDAEFAGKCRGIVGAGRRNLIARLFDGEYFKNQVDPRHLDAINSGTGCHIDQVMGQSWAFQVGLPRVLPETETRAALRSLWRYNFTPDVGPYRAAYKPGRWYAMPGEAGLLMCTFPRSDWDYERAKGKGPDWAAGYFNECMNGFEYQVASHMLWEGLLTEGLAITRAVHDRYHPARRNPFNEIECGDHYARSMASYGVFLAACGYACDGPRARLAFAPRLTPEHFKAAFTAPEGWGSFSQQADAAGLKAQVALRWGRLSLRQLVLTPPGPLVPTRVAATVDGKSVSATLELADGTATIGSPGGLALEAGATLDLTLT